jgi:DNA invertase Pin-like site-specific DNA recombinase
VLRGALHEARRHLRPGSAPRTAIRTLKTQLLALRQLAERAGSQIARKYVDHGISGAKGGDQRPGVDRLLKGATRRQFDLVMAWSVDRLGRSLQDLVAFLGDLHAQGLTSLCTSRASTP